MSSIDCIIDGATGTHFESDICREPTNAFSYHQLKTFFFNHSKAREGSNYLYKGYYFTVSCIVQCIRYTGLMQLANTVGSMLSDAPAICKLVSQRLAKISIPDKQPTHVSQVIILYLPAKDGPWQDFQNLHSALENRVGVNNVNPQFIEKWEGGGNMEEAHIDQVRQKIIALKNRYPENPLILVGWSHGAETTPWSMLDPNSYSVDNGTIVENGSRHRVVRQACQVEHVFRLCSPMTEKEALIIQKIGVSFTEVCAAFDPLIPTVPCVGEENRVWVNSAHVGAVFSPDTANVLAEKVRQLCASRSLKAKNVA
ncbi:hypothetical protein COB21_04185 [Candidatus Aerophobetes bacterium]|uniref:Uncharacterized protein n=1 Tax=Aerophobetes bacterium TaxID=2030807 RepID=A0A2A4X205_UNCAE|nr:MAG: hypothetical protein COB21_04185 [Candidatus Aerophobetes bacterium]